MGNQRRGNMEIEMADEAKPEVPTQCNRDGQRAYFAQSDTKKGADTCTPASKQHLKPFGEDSEDEEHYDLSAFGGKSLDGYQTSAVYDDGDDNYEHPVFGGKSVGGFAGAPSDDDDHDEEWSPAEKVDADDFDYTEGSDRVRSSKKDNKKRSTKNTVKKIAKKPTSKSGKGAVVDEETDEISRPISMNGRVSGRQLVLWHRARMTEKLLLHLVYECHRDNIKLPWDKAVHRLCPGSSGQSAIQMISKLRDLLITEGHLVPPLMGRRGVDIDPSIRGYVRDMESEKATDTRLLRFGEFYEDAKESLVVPGTVIGSGNYKRLKNYVNTGATTIEKVAKNADGSRRSRLPKELLEASKKAMSQKRTEVENKRKHDHRQKHKSLKVAYNKRAASEASDGNGYGANIKSEPSPYKTTGGKSLADTYSRASPVSKHGVSPSPSDTLPVVLRLSPRLLQIFEEGNGSETKTDESEDENEDEEEHDGGLMDDVADNESDENIDQGLEESPAALAVENSSSFYQEAAQTSLQDLQSALSLPSSMMSKAGEMTGMGQIPGLAPQMNPFSTRPVGYYNNGIPDFMAQPNGLNVSQSNNSYAAGPLSPYMFGNNYFGGGMYPAGMYGGSPYGFAQPEFSFASPGTANPAFLAIQGAGGYAGFSAGTGRNLDLPGALAGSSFNAGDVVTCATPVNNPFAEDALIAPLSKSSEANVAEQNNFMASFFDMDASDDQGFIEIKKA